MLCSNGIETTFPDSTGKFFICQTVNKGNQCRFSRICNQTNKYVMTTDKNGKVCPDYTVKDII